MESLLIRGGKKSEGIIELSGAKNSVLPMVAASVTVLQCEPVVGYRLYRYFEFKGTPFPPVILF